MLFLPPSTYMLFVFTAENASGVHQSPVDPNQTPHTPNASADLHEHVQQENASSDLWFEQQICKHF